MSEFAQRKTVSMSSPQGLRTELETAAEAAAAAARAASEARAAATAEAARLEDALAQARLALPPICKLPHLPSQLFMHLAWACPLQTCTTSPWVCMVVRVLRHGLQKSQAGVCTLTLVWLSACS